MAELAMLADIQRTVYPRGGPPSTVRHGAGQGKFAGHRPKFYPLCYATSQFKLLAEKRLLSEFIEHWLSAEMMAVV